jgi:hypothetical protein
VSALETRLRQRQESRTIVFSKERGANRGETRRDEEIFTSGSRFLGALEMTGKKCSIEIILLA